MPPAGYFVDTNLLLLFVVGSESTALISRHRRLETYSEEDYDALYNLIKQTGQIYVTPNTLTETSNLLGQHGEPERRQLFERFRAIIRDTQEVVVASVIATVNPAYSRLGLTDAVLLEVASDDTPLLTVDFQLYAAGLAKGERMAVNFTQFRNPLNC